jgi:protein-disulfide isomerase
MLCFSAAERAVAVDPAFAQAGAAIKQRTGDAAPNAAGANAPAGPARKPPAAERPIARLGDEVITIGDVEPDVAFQVYRQRLETYTLLVRAVNDLVERRLLEREANRRGITVEELERALQEEAEPATPADVDAYLAKNPSAAAGPKGRDRAAYYLTEQRRIQARLDFVNALRDRARFKMILKPPEQPRVAVSVEGAPARGPADAPLTVVHFASFTSQHSAASAEQIRRLERELPGKVRLLHRSLPREHDDVGLAAAQLAAEAQEKGKFWELHDRLFELGGNVKTADLDRVASELGIPPVRPGDTCYLESIKRDADEARRIGIETEPVIFVNGRYFSPTFPYEQLRQLAADELGEGTPTRRAGKPRE